MSITVGNLQIRALREMPFAHAGDALTGRTARRWPVSAILTPAEWLTLDGIYTTWRSARLAEPDTMISLSVGTTVACSGTLRGMTWSNVAAWFTEPPTPSAAGAMVGVQFELVDAAQQLTVMLREQEVGQQLEDNDSTYGTFTLGTTTLNLIGALDGYDEGPQVELSAAGVHVIRGPLVPSRVRRVQGWTHTAGAGATVRSWYEGQISSTPAVGTYWPISPPVIEQVPVIVNGARVTRFIVTVELKEIR
jgi:hypothetical protein